MRNYKSNAVQSACNVDSIHASRTVSSYTDTLQQVCITYPILSYIHCDVSVFTSDAVRAKGDREDMVRYRDLQISSRGYSERVGLGTDTSQGTIFAFRTRRCCAPKRLGRS